MVDIYSNAIRTVAWIGQSNEASRKALSLLVDIGNRVNLFYDITDHKWHLSSIATDDDMGDDSIASNLTSEEWSGIHALLSRPYWDRLWVHQEVLRSSDVVVACGNHEIEWKIIRKALICLVLKGGMPAEVHVHYRRAEALLAYESSITTYQSLGNLIYTTRRCICSDPRDRVFAVLGFLHDIDGERWSYTPQYSDSVAVTYTKATYSYMQATDGLELLRCCDYGFRRTADLPSWVPDWSCLSGPFSFDATADCTVRRRNSTKLNEDSVLHVEGLLSDRITRCVRMDSLKFTTMQDEEALDVLSLVKSLNLLSADKSLLDVLWRTLIVGGNYFNIGGRGHIEWTTKEVQHILSVINGLAQSMTFDSMSNDDIHDLLEYSYRARKLLPHLDIVVT